MRIGELNIKEMAPLKGRMLIYTRQKVEFKPYSSVDEVIDTFKDIELLEIHLFDDSKEYRAISSMSHKYREKGYIECCVSDDMHNCDEIYDETIITENEYNNIPVTVINYVTFDEKGMARVNDYRLKMGGTE